jgi:hypothetical protein
MYLRSEINVNENYCHLLNITKSILFATSNIDPELTKLDCKYQDRYDFCNNITNLFSKIYVVPTSSNIKIISVLQQAITNTLNCGKINENSIKILYFNYELVLLLLIGFGIGYFLLLKNKIKII